VLSKTTLKWAEKYVSFGRKKVDKKRMTYSAEILASKISAIGPKPGESLAQIPDISALRPIQTERLFIKAMFPAPHCRRILQQP
jgi:hypothetical protein